jgi:hypothetical protein
VSDLITAGFGRHAVLGGAVAAGIGAPPAQREVYVFQIRTLEEANPGVGAAFEATSNEGYLAQFAAAAA